MMVVLRELRTGSWNWCKTVVQWLKVWTWHAGNWNIHCGNRPFKLQIVLNEAFSIRHPGTVGCNTAPEEWSTNSKSIFGQYCFVIFCMWNKVKRKWGWSCVYTYFFNLQSVEIYIFNCTIIYIYTLTSIVCHTYVYLYTHVFKYCFVKIHVHLYVHDNMYQMYQPPYGVEALGVSSWWFLRISCGKSRFFCQQPHVFPL